jgi:hypothetical protein
MGYSSRYHAASLAAVFLALAVGILIGVGFGSDLVNGTADNLEKSLASDLDEAHAQIDDLNAQLGDERDFAAALTPAVVENRLRGREIAVVALGDLDDSLTDGIRNALEPAGAKVQEVAVVREPPDEDAVTAPGDKPHHNEARDERLARVSRMAGKALVTDGKKFDDLRTALFSRYSGQPGDIDGVVVVRDRPQNLSGRDAANTDAIEDGMIAGIQSALPDRRLAVVGAERTATDPSSIPFFTDRSLASVDNVDQLPGKVSLVYVLGGAEGEYGVKDTADAPLPDLLAPSGLDFGAEKKP